MKLPLTREEIKVRKWPFLILLGFYLVFVVYIIDVTSTEVSLKWILAGSLLFIAVLFYVVINNKIIIDNKGIVQQIFFGKQKDVEWTNIKSSKMNWDFTFHGGELSWELIDMYGNIIRINPSYYSRKNLKLLAGALLRKCAHADLDKRIFEMTEGKFPWYIF